MQEDIMIAGLWRYPVKSLGGQPCAHLTLEEGFGVAGDRLFAVARATRAGSGRVDPAAPKWHPKGFFVTLAKHERLALLQAHWDDEARHLTLLRGGQKVAAACFDSAIGQTLIEQFLAAFLQHETDGRVVLLHDVAAAAPLHLSDVPGGLVSLINLSSVADLERVVGTRVDPQRFRGNLLLRGLGAWREFDWIGRRLAIGDTILKIVEPIQRCPATNVDPTTAARDMTLPLALERGFQHQYMGGYAEVLKAGQISPADSVTLL